MSEPKTEMIEDFASYDALTRIVTIDGIRFSRDFFTFLSSDPLGSVARLDRRADGLVVLTRLSDGAAA